MNAKDLKNISVAYDKLYDVGYADDNYYYKLCNEIEQRMKSLGFTPILNRKTDKYSFKLIMK